MSSQTSRPRRRLAIGSALVLVVGVVSAPLARAASGGVETKVLTNVLPGLAALDDLGSVPADKPMTIGVTIPGDSATRDAAYRAITTPGSPSYGFHYTPAGFAAAFGVSTAVSQAVSKAVEADGLHPVYVAKDGSYLELTGTAAQVQKTFTVSVHNYRVNGKTYYASTTGATVPTAVGTVLGLTDVDSLHTHASQDTCQATQCLGTLAPDGIWQAYDEPDTFTEGDTSLKATDNYGQGQKVAIFGEGDLTQVITDLRNFEDDTKDGFASNVKPVLPHIPVVETLVNDPQTSAADTAGLGEWDLDSQSSTGMSPDLAQLQFYFGVDLGTPSIAATYSAWVNDLNGSMIGNSSFGGCEPLQAALGGETADDPLLQQAAMMGRSMFVSTGDTGSGGCVVGANVNGVANGGAPAVEYPAASPFVVAVGGTTLYTNGTGGAQTQPVTRSVEDTWDESGGGSSDFEVQPTDQAALGGTLPAFQPCVGNNAGAPTAGVTCRSVPDVAALSGDIATNGYGIETASKPGMPGSGLSETGGTSLSSPLWAGMWARVRAAHSGSGCAGASLPGGLNTVPQSTLADIGFAQQALYAVAEKSSADDLAAFFDVGGSANAQPGTTTAAGNGTYASLPRNATTDPTGFDFTAGLGVPDLSNVVRILDCGTSPTSAAIPNSTTVTTQAPSLGACPANGTTIDPAGDETPADTALDLISVSDSSDANQVVFSEKLSGLPESNPSTDNDYESLFTYGGVPYDITADNGNPGGSPTFTLSAQVTTTTPAGVTSTNETTLGTLTGMFDNPTATISLTLPYKTFNTDASPKTPLGPGSVLNNVEVDSRTQSTSSFLTSDVASFNNCPFVLGQAAASPPAIATLKPVSPSPAPTAPVTQTGFHPLSYAGLSSATVKQGHDQTVTLLGTHGIPKTQVTDVLLQVTADKAAVAAPVVIGGQPALQTVKGFTARNIVVVTPDRHGQVRLTVSRGSARIALAIVGYDSRSTGDGFNPTFGGRVSATLTPLTTAEHPLAVTIGGKGGIPASSLDAALLDARVSSVTLPHGITSATLFATVAGSSRKVAIASVSPAATTTALLVARPDRSARVTFSLSAGTAKIVVNGYGAWATSSYTAKHLKVGHAVASRQAFSATLGTRSETLTVNGLPTGVSSVVFQVSIAAGKGSGELQAATAGARFGDGSVSYLANLGSVQLISVAPDSHGRVALRLTSGSRAVKLSLVGYSAVS